MESMQPIVDYHNEKNETPHKVLAHILEPYINYNWILTYNDYLKAAQSIGLKDVLSIEQYHQLIIES